MTKSNSLLLRNILKQEAKFEPSEATLDLLLDYSVARRFKRKSTIIDRGDVCPDLYIMENGIARLSSYDSEGNESTFGFGGSGTIFLSPSAYYMGKPAYFMLIACSDCDVRIVRKDVLNMLLQKSHDLALWMFDMAMGQFYAIEMRAEIFDDSARTNLKSIINGDFKQRYIDFTKNHPDIVTSVSAKVLASYLGITPAYLSKIKRELVMEQSRRES